MSYQPKTGQSCTCRRGVERDNCPACEGTGQRIDFQAIRNCRTGRMKPEELFPSEALTMGRIRRNCHFCGSMHDAEDGVQVTPQRWHCGECERGMKRTKGD